MVAKHALHQVGASFEMDVERGKIAEFAEAVGATHPDHYRRDGAVAPATFLTTQFFWERRVDGADPWALVQMSEERGMHAEQEYIFHGPPPQAGERLTGESRISEITEKTSRSGQILVFVKRVTEFRNAAGELVAEAILTGVERQ